jgi:hypothetical protein
MPNPFSASSPFFDSRQLFRTGQYLAPGEVKLPLPPLPSVQTATVFRTLAALQYLHHKLPLERVGRRVFPSARGGFENACDGCIMFDQLPVFVPS